MIYVLAILLVGIVATCLIEGRGRRRMRQRAETGQLRPEEFTAAASNPGANPTAAEGMMRGGIGDPFGGIPGG